MTSQTRKAGFVGIGNIGTPMVLSLLRGGFEVVVRDLRREAAKEVLGAGATFAATNQELADSCDLIGVAVVNDAQTRSLLLGEDGLLAAMKPGQMLVLHSTILPATVKEMGAEAAKKDVQLVDAQLSGGDLRARKGDLAFMVGGTADEFERAKVYLEPMARRSEHMGELGAGAATKIAIQMMTFGNWVAAMESMKLAGALGLDEKKLADFAIATTADSWVAQTWGNYDRLLREHRLNGSEDLFRLFDKDLFNAVALGREIGVLLPATAVGSQVLAPLAKERLARPV
ncbi:NAD(P)-dependent oxidoreductase [Mesorhizobium sp. SB112]|uniref:NAD(P)-dependent oxidoreductase n=1 Tax=Mesorhizobium sp. SB112 TaxID=3151853 RepID=UPI0032639659